MSLNSGACINLIICDQAPDVACLSHGERGDALGYVTESMFRAAALQEVVNFTTICIFPNPKWLLSRTSR